MGRISNNRTFARFVPFLVVFTFLWRYQSDKFYKEICLTRSSCFVVVRFSNFRCFDFVYRFWFMPSFLLKKMIMNNFNVNIVDEDIADSIDFMVERVRDFACNVLASLIRPTKQGFLLYAVGRHGKKWACFKTHFELCGFICWTSKTTKHCHHYYRCKYLR